MRFHRLHGEHTAGEPDICVLSSQGPSKPATLPSCQIGSDNLNGLVISLESIEHSCGGPNGLVELNLHMQNANEKVWPGEALVLPLQASSSLSVAQGQLSLSHLQNTYSFPKTHCKIFLVMPTLNKFSSFPGPPITCPGIHWFHLSLSKGTMKAPNSGLA